MNSPGTTNGVPTIRPGQIWHIIDPNIGLDTNIEVMAIQWPRVTHDGSPPFAKGFVITPEDTRMAIDYILKFGTFLKYSDRQFDF